MTNQIDLNSFSAKKYKNELYQLRLNSYLEKSEDFEEIDFINNELKYFENCYNAVDEDFYNSQRVHWHELEGEMDYDIYYKLEPQIDEETFNYCCNNTSEQERLTKAFVLIGQFLSGIESLQLKDIPKPPQFEPVIIEEIKNTFVNEQIESKEVFNNTSTKHPKFDPNLWNNEGFELFKYLYECYYKSTKRQITNIWFYLKENGNTKYNLKATKKQYLTFIFKNYQIEITNFDKALAKWEDKECQTIDEHRINFEDTLK